MINYDFQGGLKILASARQSLSIAKEEKARILSEIEQREDYKQFSEIEAKAKADIEEVENILRESAVEKYKETKEKQVAPYIEIRVTKSLSYEQWRAVDWCKDNLKDALKLDKSLFEKHAKAVAGTAPIHFVGVIETPQATIATDLSELLKED